MKNIVELVYEKRTEEIKSAASSGANMNESDEDGRTPLMHAVLDSQASIDMIELLISLGAIVNCVDTEQKWSPLHFAVRDEKPEIVQLLISCGANVNYNDSQGNTALSKAILAQNDEIFRMLLDADPDIENRSGISARKLATIVGKEYLLK